MAKFEVTAKHSFGLEGGGRIVKGETAMLRSTDMGVRELSLFSTAERRDIARRQLAAQGIIGIKEQHLSIGTWDVKEYK